MKVRDPYRRLGVSRDASEEEIWGSRNFLLAQYAGNERSAESIEAAFEKLLMDSYVHQKKKKINLKSRLKKKVEESPPWFKNLLGFVEVPPTVIVFRRLFLFAFIAGWSIMNSAETGPAFQVCFNLHCCSMSIWHFLLPNSFYFPLLVLSLDVSKQLFLEWQPYPFKIRKVEGMVVKGLM